MTSNTDLSKLNEFKPEIVFYGINSFKVNGKEVNLTEDATSISAKLAIEWLQSFSIYQRVAKVIEDNPQWSNGQSRTVFKNSRLVVAVSNSSGILKIETYSPTRPAVRVYSEVGYLGKDGWTFSWTSAQYGMWVRTVRKHFNPSERQITKVKGRNQYLPEGLYKA